MLDGQGAGGLLGGYRPALAARLASLLRQGRWLKEGLRELLWQALAEDRLPILRRHEDRKSTAFSIESRTPFLTPALVSFVFSVSKEYIIAADGASKAVFRRAMRGIVLIPSGSPGQNRFCYA
jgi:asparagine synthase (glutamine-hydrolysing)